jgi:hypothetical protein
MEDYPDCLGVKGEARQRGMGNLDPIPAGQRCLEDVSQRRPDDAGMGDDQKVFTRVCLEQGIERVGDPVPEVGQRFRSSRAIFGGVAMESGVFAGSLGL